MKSKAHVYMANLIIKEVVSNKGSVQIGSLKTGCVSIEKSKRIKLPDEVYKALKSYPSYFRAGAVGPDFFPDLIFGQMDIHPSFSGDWITHMHDMLTRITPNTSEYYEALSFYLGYTMHYACDMFGHYDINKYANGWFPDFKSIGENFLSRNHVKATEDVFKIFRHIMVESYLDDKVSSKEDFVIDLPYDYIRICFTTTESVAFIEQMREKYKKEDSGDDIINADILYTLVKKYEQQRKNLMQGRTSVQVVEDREEYILNWISTWHTFTQKMLEMGTKNAFGICLVDFLKAFVEYTSACDLSEYERKKYIDFIDAVNSVYEALNEIDIPIISDILDWIGKLLTSPVKMMLFPFVKNFTDTLYSMFNAKNSASNFDDCIENIKKIFTEPHLWLNARVGAFSNANKDADELYRNDKNFKAFVDEQSAYKNENYGLFTYYLDYLWGNFGKEDDCLKQGYGIFQSCINMGKLCLIGADNLNKIIEKYDKTEAFRFLPQKITYSVKNLRFLFKIANESGAGSSDILIFTINCNGKDIVFPLVGSENNVFKKNSEEIIDVPLEQTIPISDIKDISFKLSGNNNLIYTFLEVIDADTGIIIAATNSRVELKNEDSVVLEKGSIFADEGVYTNFVEKMATNPSVDQKAFDEIRLFYSAKMKKTSAQITITLNCENETYTASGYISNNAICIKRLKLNRQISGIMQIKSIYISSPSDVYIDRLFIYDTTQNYCIGRLTNQSICAGSNYKVESSLFNEFYHENKYPEKNWLIKDFAVVVKTANKNFAGTDDDIYLEVYNQNNSLITKFDLDDNDNNFEKNKTDCFFKSFSSSISPDDILKFKVTKVRKHIIAPDWTYDYIFAFDTHTGQTIFSLNEQKELTGKNSYTNIESGFWKLYTKN